jgi:heptosyltransferase-3
MVRPEKKLAAMATLVYHAGALGDFITAVPALRFWKARNSNDRLFLLGNHAVGAFAKDAGVVDDYGDVGNRSFLPLFLDVFSPDVNNSLSPFQTAILFVAPGSPVINNCIQSGIKNLFWHLPFPSVRIHTIDYHLSLFTDPSTVPAEIKYPAIKPSGRSIAATTEMLPPDISPIAIHPGSGSRKKNWPFERWFLLAEAIRKKRVPLLWLLGPAEEGFEVPAQDFFVSNQPLALCAAVLSRCRAFIGSDSGMAHLSAAVGCRTIALFGPSDPVVWSPCGRDVRIIYKKKPCSPCHQSATAPLLCDNDCLNTITVGEVLDII